MKRILTLILILGILLSVPVPMAARAAEQPEALTVGHTTMMTGNFFSELWGNNTADIDVRALIHDYPITIQTEEGAYEPNGTVVSQITSEEEANGDVTYRITLKRGLQFSDGSPIGAQDYLFSFLLLSSYELGELTGLMPIYTHIKGFDEYHKGTSEVFSGLRLINNRVFTLTVKGEYLPYFYEMAYVSINPYPISVILPDAKVADDGEGAYIEGEISAEVLQKTLLDSETGYVSHPSVTSGPYRLTSYDASEHVAEFELNPYYQGNFEGQKPTIQKLRFKNILNEDIIEQLESGEVDLVNKVTDGKVIEDSRALEEAGKINASSYPRTGGAFLAIANERPITSSVKIRQALAYCIDYNELPKEFLKGHGERIVGYYGTGQWMPKTMESELFRLTKYKLDLTKATTLIVEDGWLLNKDGGQFKVGDSGLRYRRTETGELESLSLKMIVTTGNKAAELVYNTLKKNLGQIGGEVVAEEMPFDKAMRQYYSQDERDYDLLFLGTNFSYFFDPTNTYRMGDEFRGSFNTSGIQDQKLAELAASVARVPSGDVEAFLTAWIEFQVYWSKALPMIPLYSNDYYDLYTPDLKNYQPENHWSWATAILYASLDR